MSDFPLIFGKEIYIKSMEFSTSGMFLYHDRCLSKSISYACINIFPHVISIIELKICPELLQHLSHNYQIILDYKFCITFQVYQVEFFSFNAC